MTPSTSQLPLSPAGVARRGDILKTAQAALRWRRRRRSALLAASVALVPAGAALTALAAHRLSVPTVPGNARPSVAPAVAWSLVRDDDSVLARLSVPTRPLAGSLLIGDGELLDLLRESGYDDGTIRVEGRFLLASDLEPEPYPDVPPNGPG